MVTDSHILVKYLFWLKNRTHYDFSFCLMPFCYEQTSPLARRKTRYGLSFRKLKLVARLLLFPLKSCDFRGPRKADFAFWGEGKTNAKCVCFAFKQNEATSALF